MLLDRDRLDAHQLQKEVDRQKDVVRELTLSLIDSKAWGKQLDQLQHNYSVRQALVGWLDTAKRLLSTRQANRRQSLLSEARKLMTRGTPAVPVWIMPISLMAEHFDPSTSRFDVVIDKQDHDAENGTSQKLFERVAASEWFAIAKWAKQHDCLKPYQRSLAFILGLLTTKGKQATEKQVKYGVLLLEDAQRLGYKVKS